MRSKKEDKGAKNGLRVGKPWCRGAAEGRRDTQARVWRAEE